jgi:Holliday junction DNA helicase RuvA
VQQAEAGGDARCALAWLLRVSNMPSAVQALVDLGDSEKDAAAALRKLPTDIGVGEGIKLAMKSLT